MVSRRPRALILKRLILIPLLAGLFVLSFFWVRDGIIRFFGTPVPAHVTNKWESGSRRRSYHVSYRYDIDGEECRDEDSVSRSAYYEGVYHLPLTARTGEFLGQRTAALMLGFEAYWETTRLFFLLLTGGLFILILRTTHDGWIRPACERRVLETGDILTGRVIARQEKQGRYGTSYWVTYAYDRPDTGEQIVRAAETSGSIFHGFAPGGPVTIFYDPSLPGSGVAYELSNFVIEDARG